MDQPTIYNPPNPYVGVVRLFPGTLLKIYGQPTPNATRFAINLQVGPSLNPRDDLALHLSPCFAPPRVIRNSLINSSWGQEESYGNGSVINPHHPFEIMILNETNNFKIAINGAHYCEFKHRIPYQQITHLTIDGDVNISQIQITTPQYQPQSQPSAPSCPYPPGNSNYMPAPSMYPNLPSPYPAPGYSQPPLPGAPGPMPYGAHYGPSMQGPPLPGQPGPAPAPSSYGYQQPQPQSSGQSSGFKGLPIGGLGSLAGLGLGAAAGAAVLSAVNPIKLLKKKKFKNIYRSSSDSSLSSYSSRSSDSS